MMRHTLLGPSQSRRIQKLYDWFQSYGDLWWKSYIQEGLLLTGIHWLVFTESAHWTNSVSESRWLSVICLSGSSDAATPLPHTNTTTTTTTTTTRAAERWIWWDCVPSQFEILAATFGQPAKIAADNKWLPAKISCQK